MQETEAALRAFEDVWSPINRQVISSDATIRELYETTMAHAFQELWERRLGQPPEALAIFEKPIRGGGLRFVMDPLINEVDPTHIEVKIESYLQDTTKIFIETQFVWPKPLLLENALNLGERLQKMNEFIQHQIYKFISGEDK
ncbi:MAG: hypothetical protein ACYDBJ_06915 [Aggregatilineales bacterium]